MSELTEAMRMVASEMRDTKYIGHLTHTVMAKILENVADEQEAKNNEVGR